MLITFKSDAAQDLIMMKDLALSRCLASSASTWVSAG